MKKNQSEITHPVDGHWMDLSRIRLKFVLPIQQLHVGYIIQLQYTKVVVAVRVTQKFLEMFKPHIHNDQCALLLSLHDLKKSGHKHLFQISWRCPTYVL